MENNKSTTEPREYYSYLLNLYTEPTNLTSRFTEPNPNYTKTEPRLVIL